MMFWFFLSCVAGKDAPEPIDRDGDLASTEYDCDDSNPDIHPWAEEECDGIDNNCDGLIDEGISETYYPDKDGDSFGDPAGDVLQICGLGSEPDGYTVVNTDCDDSDAMVSPQALEVCGDASDNDCDAAIDEVPCVTMMASGTDAIRFSRAIPSPGDLDEDGRDDLLVAAKSTQHGSHVALLLWTALQDDQAPAVADAATLVYTDNALGQGSGENVAVQPAGSPNGTTSLIVASSQSGDVWLLDDIIQPDIHLQRDRRAEIVREQAGAPGAVQLRDATPRDEGANPSLLVGIEGEDSSDIVDAGATYFFQGLLSGSLLFAEADAVFVGQEEGDNLGRAVVSTDVTGDGVLDVVLGAPQQHTLEPKRSGAGPGYIAIFEAPWGGVAGARDASVLLNPEEGQGIGTELGAGDVNGDGYNDIVVTSVGSVYVLDGPLTSSSVPLSELAVATIQGDEGGPLPNILPALVADVDQDGLADILRGGDANVPCGLLFGPLTGSVSLSTDATVLCDAPAPTSRTINVAPVGDALVFVNPTFVQGWENNQSGAEVEVGLLGIMELKL